MWIVVDPGSSLFWAPQWLTAPQVTSDMYSTITLRTTEYSMSIYL